MPKEDTAMSDQPLLERPITRRAVLVGGSLAGFAAFLSACGISGQSQAPASTPGATTATTEGASAAATVAATAEPAATNLSGELNWANWIGYIDVSDDNKTHPTIDKFTKETTIKVNYVEAVDDNETFFSRDLKGPLDANQPTQWDLVVLTDWMIARLARLGWLDTINTANTPNFVANLADNYRGRSFDKDTNLAAPWQSGMTGIGFDKKKTGDLTSLAVFWDAKYKGKLTYLTEMRDTVGLAAIKLGFDPGTITDDQFQQSLAEVKKAVDSGIVRQLTGNSYVDVAIAGDSVVAMAWSGDVQGLIVPGQQADQDWQWALPTEGGMLWTDNMCIPKGAVNKGQAEAWINFYYEPANAATIEAYVNYVCPVKGAKEEIVKIDPELATNPLIFPPADWVARLKQFRAVTAEEEQSWAEAFSKVIGL
jgi:spermidine/putrescine transport system substrate-binding protein